MAEKQKRDMALAVALLAGLGGAVFWLIWFQADRSSGYPVNAAVQIGVPVLAFLVSASLAYYVAAE